MEEAEEARKQTYPKTHAMSVYCLAAKDLEELPFRSKPNPYRRSGPAMKLYTVADLEQAALQKWGSLDALEKERERRLERKQQRAAEKQAQGADEEGSGSAETSGSQGSQAQAPAAAAAGPVSPTDGSLHPLLRERILPLAAKQAGAAKGSHVLYWMRSAVRDHESPSLDVAKAEAAARGLPLLCASAVLGKGRHTHPTHRRCKFLLEGLREAQAGLAAQGVPHLVWVDGLPSQQQAQQQQPQQQRQQQPQQTQTQQQQQQQQAQPQQQQQQAQQQQAQQQQQAAGGAQAATTDAWQALLCAAQGADLVVTDLMPTPPYTQNLQDLAQALGGAADLWAVDSSCIVPVTLSKAAPTKAYAFRNATSRLRRERLQGLPYASGAPPQPTSNPGAATAAAALPCAAASLDLAAVPDIAALLHASAALDASVPGVSHMPGGQAAGYARWEAFKQAGLAQYAARRNNPMLRAGVSRLSAYHHFGMVSPFRVARDATRHGSAGATKFADEFLTWRELSFAFCHHSWRRGLESLQVLPAWAQRTLAAHAGDARDVKSLAQLEAGDTGDEVWDALQHQLNTTGELHNNVRMTWGKAVLRWTPDPESALRTVAHLNHRYALDGCDPSSYGGILWTFGLFDGPKGEASTPIFGTLRNRPTAWLTKRLTPAKFRALPLDEPPASGGGGGAAAPPAAAAAAAAGGADIRRMFAAAAAAQPGPATPAKAREAPAPPQAPQPAAGAKRGEATQASLDKFFKRSRA